MKKISERKTGGAMKFSFSTKGWNLPTWADFIEKACEMGYDGIEIHDIHNRTFTGKNAVFDIMNVQLSKCYAFFIPLLAWFYMASQDFLNLFCL